MRRKVFVFVIFFLSCAMGLSSEERVSNPSEACSNNGEFIYGGDVCNCYPGYYGKHCEIGEKELCRSPEQPNAALCLGRGDCVFGDCICGPIPSVHPLARTKKSYSGKFCECNDYTCPYYNGEMCGGDERGECRCGECVCKEDYIGESCNCSTTLRKCMASNGVICNGKGDCLCGECQCDEGSFGPACEDNIFVRLTCGIQRSCIQCLMFKTGILNSQECTNKCSYLNLEPVEQLPENELLCEYMDEDGCIYSFSYLYDENNRLSMKAKRKRECQNTWGGHPYGNGGTKSFVTFDYLCIYVTLFFINSAL